MVTNQPAVQVLRYDETIDFNNAEFVKHVGALGDGRLCITINIDAPPPTHTHTHTPRGTTIIFTLFTLTSHATVGFANVYINHVGEFVRISVHICPYMMLHLRVLALILLCSVLSSGSTVHLDPESQKLLQELSDSIEDMEIFADTDNVLEAARIGNWVRRKWDNFRRSRAGRWLKHKLINWLEKN
ncbi:unnamed protein product [Mesocestoides corti]|uniref:Secreted protein n=1 Tax=Mesocestoides corti TaxID=53468 RepID=A0A0R3U9I9_MESCO|nr:unnamed protein product [Mesocestoides corti]